MLLGPLTATDLDVASFVQPRVFPWLGSKARVGLLAQGLQRKLSSSGHVSALLEPSAQLVAALKPGVTVFLSDVETETWANGTLERLVKQHAGHIIVTLGSSGADEYRPGHSVRRHPSFQVGKVVDTNGAGDSFATAYMLGLAREHPNPAALANWAGGMAVTRPQACKPQCTRDALQGGPQDRVLSWSAGYGVQTRQLTHFSALAQPAWRAVSKLFGGAALL